MASGRGHQWDSWWQSSLQLPEKQVPPLHKECFHVNTHKLLNFGTFTEVVTALSFLAYVAKPFLRCRVCGVLQTACPELSAAPPFL